MYACTHLDLDIQTHTSLAVGVPLKHGTVRAAKKKYTNMYEKIYKYACRGHGVSSEVQSSRVFREDSLSKTMTHKARKVQEVSGLMMEVNGHTGLL